MCIGIWAPPDNPSISIVLSSVKTLAGHINRSLDILVFLTWHFRETKSNYPDWHTWTPCNKVCSVVVVCHMNACWSAHCHRLAWIIRWQMTPHNTSYVVSRWSSRNRRCSWSDPAGLSVVWKWRWACLFSTVCCLQTAESPDLPSLPVLWISLPLLFFTCWPPPFIMSSSHPV